MTHAVGILLDDQAEERVRQLWRRLDDIGIASAAAAGVRPQVTLAAAEHLPKDVLLDIGRDGPRLTWRDLSFATVGLFGTTENVVFLGVVLDLGLLGLHQKFLHTLHDRVTGLSSHYQPGVWVPHCTLALDVPPERIGDAVAALHPVAPIRARVAGLAVTDAQAGRQVVLWQRR